MMTGKQRVAPAMTKTLGIAPITTKTLGVAPATTKTQGVAPATGTQQVDPETGTQQVGEEPDHGRAGALNMDSGPSRRGSGAVKHLKPGLRGVGSLKRRPA